jgi:protein-tyrosine phosphatase
MEPPTPHHDVKPPRPPTIPPTGRIDIHCHLLPGIDDGCRNLAESVECVKMLKNAGFIGSICTPHIWPSEFPQNLPQKIADDVAALQNHLAELNIDYLLWPGGEMRLFDNAISWMQTHGVPTLAGTRRVLTDMWNDDWPHWAVPTYQWLIDQGYQPILAHPERMLCLNVLHDCLDELINMGVWLQGNARCMTGEEGQHPDRLIRQWLRENRYQILALDAHRPNTLQARLDGLNLVQAEFSRELLDQLTVDAPRNLIFASKPA